MNHVKLFEEFSSDYDSLVKQMWKCDAISKNSFDEASSIMTRDFAQESFSVSPQRAMDFIYAKKGKDFVFIQSHNYHKDSEEQKIIENLIEEIHFDQANCIFPSVDRQVEIMRSLEEGKIGPFQILEAADGIMALVTFERNKWFGDVTFGKIQGRWHFSWLIFSFESLHSVRGASTGKKFGF